MKCLILFPFLYLICGISNAMITPNYCQPQAKEIDYNLYQTQTNSAIPTVKNSKIIGEKLLSDNPIEQVVLSKSDYLPNQYDILIILTRENGLKLYKFTSENIGKHIGFTANDKLITNGTIQGIFDNHFKISSLKKSEAEHIFNQLKYANCH